MRLEHTGIFERTIRETPEEWFHGFLGSVNSVLAVAECAKRARETFRKVLNLPEDASTKNVTVRLDGLKRPLPETQERDENRKVFENLARRDLRNNPVAEYVRELLFAEEVFRLTRQKRDALWKLLEIRKQRKLRSVELLRELTLVNENLQSLAMHIAALDIKIAVAEFEPAARTGGKMRGKNIETNKERRRNTQEKITKFAELYEGTSKPNRIEKTRKAFSKALQEENEKREKEGNDKIKTPSGRTAYTWLADAKKRSLLTT
jgi:hypothetical protein